MKTSLTEAYVYSLLTQSLETLSFQESLERLLGLYVCDILDLPPSPNTLKDYFSLSGRFWEQTNLLWGAIEALDRKGHLKHEPTPFFENFTTVHADLPADISLEDSVEDFISRALQPHLTQEQTLLIPTIVKTLFKCLKGDKSGATQYEMRFFGRPEENIEVYALFPILFKPSAYSFIESEETYVLHENGLNLKVEDGELYLKRTIQDLIPIDQFMKKQKVRLPLDLTPYPTVRICKKRHVLKEKKKLKIDFSTLYLEDKKWVSVCFESPSLATVMALSLLLNRKILEKLSYVDFLRRSALS